MTPPKDGNDAGTGLPVRIDEAAESADPDLPAFLATPRGAPAYHGFPILADSECEGFTFGTITDPKGAEWGDAFVVAPNGSRAGIVWQLGEGESSVVVEPTAGRWGVYSFNFSGPITTDQDLVRHLHAALPTLRDYYYAAEKQCPGSTEGT